MGGRTPLSIAKRIVSSISDTLPDRYLTLAWEDPTTQPDLPTSGMGHESYGASKGLKSGTSKSAKSVAFRVTTVRL